MTELAQVALLQDYMPQPDEYPDGRLPTNHDIREKQVAGRQFAVLVAYSRCGTIQKAAAAAGMSRWQVYQWITRDTYGFKRRFQVAQDAFNDSLEADAFGILAEKPHQHDLLRITMLNAHKPSKYRPNTAPVDTSVRDILKTLRQVAEKDLDKRTIDVESRTVSDDGAAPV